MERRERDVMPWKQKRKTEYNRVVYTTNVCFVRTFFEMDPFPNVPAYQKAELNQFIDEQQLKDSTRYSTRKLFFLLT